MPISSGIFGGAAAKAISPYFEWKYEQNPWAGGVHIRLAVDGSVPVGMLGAYATSWEIGAAARPVRLVNLADAVVHPGYRRHGLLRRLMTRWITGRDTGAVTVG